MANRKESPITDAMIRDDLAHGLTEATIARKYSITRQSVNYRVKRLSTDTTATTTLVVNDETRQYVESQLNAIAVLASSHSRVQKLLDACDAWLTDCKDPTRYNLDARADEVVVTYLENDGEGGQVKAQAKLSDLLNRLENGGMLAIRGETKHADPRELILKTAQEVRQTVALAVDLSNRIAETTAMRQFREALLEEIRKAEPEVAKRIAAAIKPLVIVRVATSAE